MKVTAHNMAKVAEWCGAAEAVPGDEFVSVPNAIGQEVRWMYYRYTFAHAHVGAVIKRDRYGFHHVFAAHDVARTKEGL